MSHSSFCELLYETLFGFLTHREGDYKHRKEPQGTWKTPQGTTEDRKRPQGTWMRPLCGIL